MWRTGFSPASPKGRWIFISWFFHQRLVFSPPSQNGLSRKIRTFGLLNPNQALYQTELYLDIKRLFCRQQALSPFIVDFQSCSTIQEFLLLTGMAGTPGLEPGTRWLTASCSAYWAMPPYLILLAKVLGFEPRLTVLETVVLPLNTTPLWSPVRESNSLKQSHNLLSCH